MPSILSIDDKERVTLNLEEGYSLQHSDPESVGFSDLERTDLVLVDFVLDGWSENNAEAICRRPPDGLAVAQTLRRHANALKRPVGIAILTGEPKKIAEPLPYRNRNHILASLNAIEWVFEKDDPNLSAKVQSLASAISLLPKKWGTSTAETKSILSDFMGVPSPQCLDKALAYGPPLHDLSK